MAKRVEFDELAKMLRDKTVISTMGSFVTRLCRLSINAKTQQELMSVQGVVIPENINIRVVLASFMIAYHKESVFESVGALETAVQTSSRALTESIQFIVDHLMRGGAWRDLDAERRRGFPVLMSEYLSTFKAWKIPDEEKLTKRIQHALTALYEVPASFPRSRSETVFFAIRSY